MNERVPCTDQEELVRPKYFRPLRAVPGSENIDFVFSCARGSQAEGILGFLQKNGFPAEDYQGLPAFREKDAGRVAEALRLIFDNREKIDGWWNLSHAFSREGVCTSEELRKAIRENTSLLKDKRGKKGEPADQSRRVA